MKRLLFLLISLGNLTLFAQKAEINPVISPDFFAADEQITITYDVTGTSLQDLSEAWLWLWLPDMQNVNIATNINPASSNISATSPAKFTKSNVNGRHYFTISLILADFTAKPAESISEIGLLIKGNDWSDGQSIDFVTKIHEGFTLVLESPSGNYGFFNSAETIDIIAKTSESATIEIFIDDVLTESVSNTLKVTFAHQIQLDGKVHTILVKATNASESKEAVYSYTSSSITANKSLPPGLINGINYHEDGKTATLVLLAPGKKFVFVLGDFNNWILNNDYLMHQDGERFWITIENLVPQKEYVFQYLIDGEILVADPYTDKISDPWDDKNIDENTYQGLIAYPSGKTQFRASVLQTGQIPYNWINTDFMPPVKENIIIYELLVRDFDQRHSYISVIEKLDYLQELGINVLSLMPVNEFEGNQSWGYNPNFYFAPDKYYGNKNELKKLIDECHSRGIAVILDLVLNHSFNSSPLARMYWNESANRPAADNPWYNEQHNFENTAAHWGSDFNHESPYTKAFIDSVNSYWINEYHVNGFRFDFTKGFGNQFKSNSSDTWGSKYDSKRVALLKRMASQIWSLDSTTYVIFEHLADNTEEQELANYGIMLWGNLSGDFRRLSKGSGASLSWLYHGYRGWEQPNLVGYMESHDEERQAWDALKTFDLDYAMDRLKLNAAFFFNVPGPKLIWQFGEMGYDEELNNDRLGIKPTHWEYLENEERKELFDVYKSLINLKTKTDYIDAKYFDWSASANTKWISISHPDVAISVVGNFDNSVIKANAHFTKNGTWYDYFSEETIDVTDFENHEIILSDSEFRIFTSEKIENYIEGNPANYILSTDIKKNDGLTIYPNPTSDYLMIKNTSNWSFQKIIDVTGNTILESVNSKKIEVNSLAYGLYYVVLQNSNGEKIIKRFIKD